VIAVDTSSFVAYLKGDNGRDIVEVDLALELNQLALPPIVLTEILSDPKISEEMIGYLKALPTFELLEGFWERAGRTRSKVLAKGFKARIADAIISQICIDHKVSLITRDKDFRAFSKICGLDLRAT
jgi:predicted nucleic acid-binding protein